MKEGEIEEDIESGELWNFEWKKVGKERCWEGGYKGLRRENIRRNRCWEGKEVREKRIAREGY